MTGIYSYVFYMIDSFPATTIPIKDPIMQWVVESGSPKELPKITDAAVATCAQNPL